MQSEGARTNPFMADCMTSSSDEIKATEKFPAEGFHATFQDAIYQLFIIHVSRQKA